MAVMSRSAAMRITGKIKSQGGMLGSLVAQAFTGRAWEALDEGTWIRYCEKHFGEVFTVPAEVRVPVVVELRGEGLPQAVIAKAVGVTQSQVSKDWAARDIHGEYSEPRASAHAAAVEECEQFARDNPGRGYRKMWEERFRGRLSQKEVREVVSHFSGRAPVIPPSGTSKGGKTKGGKREGVLPLDMSPGYTRSQSMRSAVQFLATLRQVNGVCAFASDYTEAQALGDAEWLAQANEQMEALAAYVQRLLVVTRDEKFRRRAASGTVERDDIDDSDGPRAAAVAVI